MKKIMTKNDKILLVITTIVCLLPLVFGAIVYNRLPGEIPIHFNYKGEADGYASKLYGIIFTPVFLAVMNIFSHIMLLSDPKKQNISRAFRNIFKWFLPFMSITLQSMSLIIALGYGVSVNMVVMTFIGFLFVVMGNYMPKSRQNYVVGIKVPWTLNDEENWRKTHRLAGYLWMGGGIITLVLGFVFNSLVLFLIIVTIMAVIPVGYSYLLYIKTPLE